jgi:hypothetical protein
MSGSRMVKYFCNVYREIYINVGGLHASVRGGLNISISTL